VLQHAAAGFQLQLKPRSQFDRPFWDEFRQLKAEATQPRRFRIPPAAGQGGRCCSPAGGLTAVATGQVRRDLQGSRSASMAAPAPHQVARARF